MAGTRPGCGELVGVLGSPGEPVPVTPRLTADARRLLALQRGLIADWQSSAVGLNRRRLRDACADGWEQVSPHVFSDRVGELTEGQMRLCAPLEIGRCAVLGGRAALVEAGWRADGDGWVDVLVPRGARSRARGVPPWIRLHYVPCPDLTSGTPPRCHPARAAIDAAAWARTPREVLFILTSAVQQRVTSLPALRREAEGRSRVRHAGAIRDALDEIRGGATSTNEADFLRECRRRGLPVPCMQVRRLDAYSQRRSTDAEFRLPDGRLLIVEVDGVGHFELGQWQADLARSNGLAVATGALVLHVTGWEVRRDPDPFFKLLEATLSGSALTIPTI
jgi:very-short-patch-repair endonuclease